jgi:hypothetical protein
MLTYSGMLEEVGPGRLTSSLLSKRGYVKIGGQRVRSVTVTDFMDGLLEPGEDMTLSMGFFFFRRWLLAVKQGNETLREGLFVFLGGMMTHLVGVALIALPVALLASGIGEAAGWMAAAAVMLYGFGTAALNLKAWLLPG